jgi:hypothetical protein
LKIPPLANARLVLVIFIRKPGIQEFKMFKVSSFKIFYIMPHARRAPTNHENGF